MVVMSTDAAIALSLLSTRHLHVAIGRPQLRDRWSFEFKGEPTCQAFHGFTYFINIFFSNLDTLIIYFSMVLWVASPYVGHLKVLVHFDNSIIT